MTRKADVACPISAKIDTKMVTTPGEYVWSNFLTQDLASALIPQPDSAVYQLL